MHDANNIAIIGASGGLGSAFVRLFSADPSNTVYAFSRSQIDSDLPNVYGYSIDLLDENSIDKAAQQASKSVPLDVVIVATGLLYDGEMQPEKSLQSLTAANLARSYLVNTIGPTLVAKYFLPKLRRDKRAIFAALSARVGSITDNRLGGWYAYRASKAALNMLIKSISIEIARRQKHTIVVGLHPGTVATKLSQPFQKRVPTGSLFSADYAAKQLAWVLAGLTITDSGKVLAWDASEIPS